MAIETLEPATTVAPREGCTDEQLARAAAAGDVQAFEALYERHHRGLLSFCRHMLGGVHDAEDVVQHHVHRGGHRLPRSGGADLRARVALHGRAEPLRLPPARAPPRA